MELNYRIDWPQTILEDTKVSFTAELTFEELVRLWEIGKRNTKELENLLKSVIEGDYVRMPELYAAFSVGGLIAKQTAKVREDRNRLLALIQDWNKANGAGVVLPGDDEPRVLAPPWVQRPH